MQLTHDEFLEYIKKNGVTDARTTEDWAEIPKGTLIKFGEHEGIFISSHSIYLNGEKQYKYKFLIEWDNGWRDLYKGKFEVVLPASYENTGDEIIKKTLDNLEVGDVLVGKADSWERKIIDFSKNNKVVFLYSITFGLEIEEIENAKRLYTLKQPKKTLELSLSEIAEKLGVDEVKIK